MGIEVASSILNKAAILLFDVNNVKWSRAELLSWLNDAQRALVALVPEASQKTSYLKMVVGIRQTLPGDAYMLLEIARNMGTTGTVSGRALKRVDRQIIEETQPDWSSAAQVTPVTVYMYNLRDRLSYYVSPPSDGTGYLEVIYSQIPVALAETDPVLVADIYVPALLDYVMWRAKSKGAPFAGGPDEAGIYFKSFSMFVAANSNDAGKLAAEMGAMKTNPPQQQGAMGAE